MQKLKGLGPTFSTSGKSWQPFSHNPRIASRNARLHRLLQNGTIQPMTKAEMRLAAADAIVNPPVNEQGKPIK